MRIGLFGGSFDPIHRGHVAPIRVAREQLGLDWVDFLPTARPPHKSRRELAEPLQRYCMVELALLGDPDLRVSPREMTEHVSYTIDTLESYAARWVNASLFLIVGADSLTQLTSWRRWEDILQLATVAVLTRPETNGDAKAGLHPGIEAAKAAGRVVAVVHAAEPASSTEIRRRLASGQPLPKDWMDQSVLDYIAKYEVYR